MKVILLEMGDLKSAVKEAMVELQQEQQNREKLLTVNQVSKRLGKAYQTIKKATLKGMIKTTKDGLISEAAIQEYLQNIK